MKKFFFILACLVILFVVLLSSCGVSNKPLRSINKHNKKELRGPRNTKPLNSIGDQNRKITSASPGGMVKSCPAI